MRLGVVILPEPRWLGRAGALATRRGPRLRSRVDVRPPRLANPPRPTVVLRDAAAVRGRRGDRPHPDRAARRVSELPSSRAVRQGGGRARRPLQRSAHTGSRRGRHGLGRDDARSRAVAGARAHRTLRGVRRAHRSAVALTRCVADRSLLLRRRGAHGSRLCAAAARPLRRSRRQGRGGCASPRGSARPG